MMQADLFTDRLIHLMRDAFAQETLDPERRARIRARIASSPSVQGMELWANPATPFDGPSVVDTEGEADQLWLFPDFEMPTPPAEAAMSPLLHG